MTSDDLNRKLYDRPFRPFRIKLSNSTALDVLKPWQLQVGETTAIIPVEIFHATATGIRWCGTGRRSRSPTSPN